MKFHLDGHLPSLTRPLIADPQFIVGNERINRLKRH